MSNSKIINISYVRTSTNSNEQLTSLGNQYNILKDHSNILVTHIGSGGKGIPEKLKNTIIENNKNGDIQLNIMSIDRLSRNFMDVNFLKKYVKYINVLDENKIYNVKIEWDILLHKIVTANKELEAIIERCKRKRSVDNDVMTDNNDNEIKIQNRIINLKKRCNIISENLIKFGFFNKSNINTLKDFIIISQKLNSMQDWNNFFRYGGKLGLNQNNLKKNYANCLEKQKNNNFTFRIMRNDLLEFIKNILEKNKVKYDDNIFIKNFVNSNITLEKYKNNINFSDDDEIKINIDNFIVSLEKINFSDNDFEKIEEIILKKKQKKNG
jgi:hypothetical protein